ncbi:MAG: hypothetical protein FWH27_13265, partial [Planctomycetaceae bacterium]|nr:hypothetical protein [Planctomycetaceae bacterium]
MRYMQLTLAILLLAVTFLLGCGQRPPKGMPPVYPCKITLTKDGNPFANVSVGLINNSMSGSLAVGGATNANGVAEINSSYGSTYSTKGAPAGEFQVILTEVPAIPEDQRVTGEELSKMSGPEADAAIARM